MATIDFSLIENWLKNHGGKSFKRGELDGSPAREMYKTFVQTIIEGSDFEADYSAWQNSGHTLTYFWAKIRNKAPQKKNSFLGIAMSAQIVNGELEILMRLESEDKKIKDLPLKERKEINRKLLQEISSPRCYYDSNINSKTYPYDKALQIIEDDIKYISPSTFKMRPNIRLESPFTEERSLEIISDAKNVFELFKTAYNKMFEGEDTWWPSLSEYDPQLTKEDWKKYILEIEKPEHPKPLKMLKQMMELGGIASCKELSEKYGETPNFYVGCVMNLGRRVKKYFNLPPCMDGEQERYFPFPFQGKYQGSSEDNYIYRMRPELKAALNEVFTKQNEEEVNVDMPCELNTILYGPPGTGKTYHTAIYAVAIIEKKKLAEVATEEYDEVLARYNEYKKNGKIAFTTFHQSYGYEEFIEGIKPVVTTEEDEGKSDVQYAVASGIFKNFCDKAVRRKSISQVADYGLNESPNIWKVSLEGTGDNPTRTECLNNDHIRIGWDAYGKDITDETDFSTDGGKKPINAFINRMRVGDIVLSCYSATTIDAIGVITGEYEWHDEYQHYKRLRNVNWIVKNVKENIMDITDGTTMTLSSVYRFANITLDDVLKIVEKYNVEEVASADANDNYVFIIDEINRGNISKIFGELITLIEPSKRVGAAEEMTAILPYSAKPFGVPNNVYIIGTMNTADRSIATIDTALRRRFYFKEMLPNPSVLEDIYVEDVSISEMLDLINKRISVLYDREHTIGHAYFMPLKANPTVDTLARIFENNIIPLLQEYFYEDYEKIRLVLGDNHKGEDAQFVIAKSNDYVSLFGNVDVGLDDGFSYDINKSAFANIEAYRSI